MSLVCFATKAQVLCVNENQKFPQTINQSISVCEDTKNELTIKNIQQKKFEKTDKKYLHFPFSNATYWVKFEIKNNGATPKDLYLLWGNSLVEHLDFYITESHKNQFSHQYQGIITNQREKPLVYEFPKFSIVLKPNQSKTVFIKMRCKRAHFALLYLHNKPSFFKSRIDNHSNQGFLNGLMIFRLLLIFTLAFFVIKDKNFSLYSSNILFRSSAYWGYTNIAGPLFTNNPDWAIKIDFVFFSTFSVGVALYLLFATDIKKMPKWNSYLIYLSLFATLFFDFLTLFDYQWYWLKAGLLNIVISSIYFLILVVYGIFKKNFIDIFYAIPMVFGLAGTTMLLFPLTGWLDYLPLYSFSYFLFACEFLVFIFFLGRIIKISEREKITSEKQLQLKQVQNQQLQELDEIKTRFFTNISHEFRTPLSLLVGPIDDLQQKYPNENILKIAKRNLFRLQNLVNQILDISKLESGKMKIQYEEVDFAQFLTQIVVSFDSLAKEKNIKLDYSTNQKTVFGKIDLDKTEKILSNLISNAIKFTPENGSILVGIVFDFSIQKNTSQVRIRVQDSGIGISKERLPFIFNRFYQVDDSSQRLQEGTGIGLALVKELSKVLKGSIAVESEPNKGTCFNLVLPFEVLETVSNPSVFQRKEYISTDAVDENFLVENAETHAQIMLIVEDNPDLRYYIASIFKNQYQLLLAENGEEGLEKAIEFVPDIIISDLMMPKMDGMQLCTALKNDERISHIPLIMLTAKSSISDKLLGLEQGADDYLSKPFNREELSVRVANLIRQRQLLQEKYSQFITENQAENQDIVPNLEDLFLSKVKMIIDKYLDKSDFNVAIFAQEMNLSAVQLRRKLKAITNQTIIEFVRNYRLEKASIFLKNSDSNVSEIAYKVGFESMPYFSKVFQEKFGKTASEWKEG